MVTTAIMTEIWLRVWFCFSISSGSWGFCFLNHFVPIEGTKHFYVFIASYGEGNGKPLQYSCLENPMDGGAW